MIGGLGNTSFSRATLKVGGFSGTSASGPPAQAPPPREDYGSVLRQAVKLRRSLEALRASMRTGRADAPTGSPASTVNIPGVGVAFSARTASLRSAEVNAEASSFERGAHAFSGASTSVATVTGTWEGGTDERLRMRALSGGVVGQDDIVMELRNEAGDQTEFFTLRAIDGPDAAWTFDNGLTVRFGAGSIERWDTVDVQVAGSTPGAVDPDRAFSEGGGLAVGFEAGQQVVAGSFSVNGVSVAVGADDSITTVLARLTASPAGVNASFDAQSEQVVLTRKQPGLEPIELGPDTSGFLAATRLTEGTRGLSTTVTTSEINPTPSRFAPVAPAFAGASTSAPTVGGTYTGARDETLTFEVVGAGGAVGGGSELQLAVRDAAGHTLQTVSFAAGAPAGSAVQLSNGLELSLGAGTLEAGDTFSVDVVGSLGAGVDPAAAFDAAPGAGPGFRAGFAVGAGSFQVNGVSIAVAADDSIDSVLERISASGAGVVASFDAGTETIQLRRTSPGDLAITLTNDSSGFLAATGLDAAAEQRGAATGAADMDVPLGSIAAFSALQSGSFQVNGHAIALDVGVDSMRDLVARISASGAGATASIDEDGHLQLRSTVRGREVTLEDDGTAFFATVGVTATSEALPARGPGQIASPRKAVDALADVAAELNELLRGSAQPTNVQENAPKALRDDLRSMLGRALSGLTRVQSRRLGLRFDGDPQARAALTLDGQGRSRLESTVRNDSRALLDFLKNPTDAHPEGLLDAMLDRVKAAETRLAALVGTKGQLLSISA